MPCCCAPNCSSRTEHGIRQFGFPTDRERTENGALYKPEVSSLHDVVFNSMGRGDNWSYKTCKVPVTSSPPINKHSAVYRPDALPIAQPTVSEH